MLLLLLDWTKHNQHTILVMADVGINSQKHVVDKQQQEWQSLFEMIWTNL